MRPDPRPWFLGPSDPGGSQQAIGLVGAGSRENDLAKRAGQSWHKPSWSMALPTDPSYKVPSKVILTLSRTSAHPVSDPQVITFSCGTTQGRELGVLQVGHLLY